MRKRIVFWVLVAGLLVAGLAIYISRGAQPLSPPIAFANGKVYWIEGISYGTNHQIGRNAWWNVPLRKVLPYSVIRYLTPDRPQSQDASETPSLVIWLYARNAKTGKYVDSQGMLASFVDDRGDVYPATSTACGSFEGNLVRQTFKFSAFPRRQPVLTFHLAARKSDQDYTVSLKNPAPLAPEEHWTSEPMPATHTTNGLQITLAALALHTNGGPKTFWEPLSRHWHPVFKLVQNGQPATGWAEPEWEAEDPAGNRGRTLGLREPIQKFHVITRPLPEAIAEDSPDRWQLPAVAPPEPASRALAQTHRNLRGANVEVIGLFPPGDYTFSEGQLTNMPGGKMMANGGWVGTREQIQVGVWRQWSDYGNATNYILFVRFSPTNRETRLAARRRGGSPEDPWLSPNEGPDNIMAFDVAPPPKGKRVALDLVVLTPVQTQFTVQAPQP
jgi:hypothetical protein